MGKGSSPRPFNVSNQEYANRWDAIFGRDNEKKSQENALESGESDCSRLGGRSDNTEGKTGQTETS